MMLLLMLLLQVFEGTDGVDNTKTHCEFTGDVMTMPIRCAALVCVALLVTASLTLHHLLHTTQ